MQIASLATANSPNATAASTSSSKITSDFDTFLRMLTVQMQNQDPLNPIDSADYAVQLATFSGVEQQVRTNQLLQDLQGRFQQFGLAEMASWIGKDARSASAVRYEGAPVTLMPSPDPGATQAILAVRDSSGNLVSREEIPARSGPYQWLGAGIDGSPLPPGNYSFEVESLNGDTVMSSRPVERYARILEARGSSNGTVLVLEGGIEVAASSITALRNPVD